MVNQVFMAEQPTTCWCAAKKLVIAHAELVECSLELRTF